MLLARFLSYFRFWSKFLPRSYTELLLRELTRGLCPSWDDTLIRRRRSHEIRYRDNSGTTRRVYCWEFLSEYFIEVFRKLFMQLLPIFLQKFFRRSSRSLSRDFPWKDTGILSGVQHRIFAGVPPWNYPNGLRRDFSGNSQYFYKIFFRDLSCS